jgi:hypothetical protein
MRLCHYTTASGLKRLTYNDSPKAMGMNEISNRNLNKVPQVTLAFWLIKIMATTVGETGADYLIWL